IPPCPVAPAGGRAGGHRQRQGGGVLEETQDTEEIIGRVAALDIGKAELVCCVRVPSAQGSGKRAQEVRTYQTMTRSLLVLADRLGELGVTRVEKLLEDAQIKLSVVASDIFGVSGRDMLAALIAGERDPKALAQLARRR